MGLLSPTEGWNFTFYLPSGGGPGGRSWSVRDCFMFITIAGTTPTGAASALRASAAAGPACAASPGLIVGGAGSAAGGPGPARAGSCSFFFFPDGGRGLRRGRLANIIITLYPDRLQV